MISNPMKAFGPAIILFKPGMSSVQQKAYRSVHLRTKMPEALITINSSWTLTDENDQKFCLNSTQVGDHAMKNMSFKGVYCVFKNLSQLIPEITEIQKGCNDEAGTAEFQEILPTDCQPIFPSNCNFLQ